MVRRGDYVLVTLQVLKGGSLGIAVSGEPSIPSEDAATLP